MLSIPVAAAVGGLVRRGRGVRIARLALLFAVLAGAASASAGAGPISLVGSPVSASIASGSTLTLPSFAPQAGDLVLLLVAQRDETRAVSVSGNGLVWTEIAKVDNVQGQGGVSLWRGQGSAPSAGSVAVSVAGNAAPVVAIAQRFAGVDAAAPVEAVATNSGPSADDDDMLQAVVTRTPGAWAVAAGWQRTMTLSLPAGESAILVNALAGSGGSVTRGSLWYQGPVDPPGSTQLGAAGDLAGSQDWAMIVVSLKPGAAAPAPTPPSEDSTSVSTPEATAAPAGGGPVAKGIWLSLSQIQQLPQTGSAWTQVKSVADGSLGSPGVADLNSSHDVKTLAAALVYARTGNVTYRKKAADAISAAIGTEAGGGTLALGRNLVSYVIAADLVNLREYSASKDASFVAWLRTVRTLSLGGTTLIATHELRPNNVGLHAGASRIAADLYLGDTGDLARAATVFRGWLGDRSAYAGFKYGDLSWQSNPSQPVGINPKGATKDGHSVDGVLPDDQRRAGGFKWPPPCENYVTEALQGAMVQAELLSRAGYTAWTWSDRALHRAVTWFVSTAKCKIEGDDEWESWLVNKAYGASFPTVLPAQYGKNMGFTDWTHR